MFFVASEHVFRRGFLSKLLKWGLNPIPRVKGSTDTSSALAILRTIRYGGNVAIFAEGERSWNGVTDNIHPTTSRLIKASKASLITYRLTGGYLTSPRWSGALRRGRMGGRCVRVYTPEEIAAMTAEELESIISHDLRENAFDTQHEEMVRYKGKKLAEELESALYVCPRCQGVQTLRSENDRFSCSCGLDMKFTEYGFFEGSDLPFDNILDWDNWQTEFLQEYVAGLKGSEKIYTSEDQSLFLIEDDHRERQVARGTLSLYADRLEIGSFLVHISELSGIAQYGRQAIVFSSGGKNFEIKPRDLSCARKYTTMANLLREAQKGKPV